MFLTRLLVVGEQVLVHGGVSARALRAAVEGVGERGGLGCAGMGGCMRVRECVRASAHAVLARGVRVETGSVGRAPQSGAERSARIRRKARAAAAAAVRRSQASMRTRLARAVSPSDDLNEPLRLVVDPPRLPPGVLPLCPLRLRARSCACCSAPAAATHDSPVAVRAASGGSDGGGADDGGSAAPAAANLNDAPPFGKREGNCLARPSEEHRPAFYQHEEGIEELEAVLSRRVDGRGQGDVVSRELFHERHHFVCCEGIQACVDTIRYDWI